MMKTPAGYSTSLSRADTTTGGRHSVIRWWQSAWEISDGASWYTNRTTFTEPQRLDFVALFCHTGTAGGPVSQTKWKWCLVYNFDKSQPDVILLCIRTVWCCRMNLRQKNIVALRLPIGVCRLRTSTPLYLHHPAATYWDRLKDPYFCEDNFIGLAL